MQPRITQAVKAAIIQDWVRGVSRDAIAAKHGLSAGTVTNTVQEWELGLGNADAAEVRELGVALKKLGITTPRCAEGARVVSMMASLGIDENNFYSFMSETYERCVKSGLQPERIAHNLKQLLDLSESIPWEQIPDHIEQQVARKQKLEQEIQRLESEVSEVRTRLNKALEEEGVTMKELNCFSNFTREVRRHRIPMEDLPKFVNTINGVGQLGYDPKTIVSKFSDFERLQIVEKELMDRVDGLTTKKTDLERKCAFLETSIEAHSITISKYQEARRNGLWTQSAKDSLV